MDQAGPARGGGLFDRSRNQGPCRRTVTAGELKVSVEMIEGPRQQLMQGKFDPAAELLEAADQIRETAKGIPYFGW